MSITADQFAGWKEHPVTQELLKTFQEMKEKHQEYLLDGGYLKSNNMIHDMEAHLSWVRGLNSILSITFDEKEGVIFDD